MVSLKMFALTYWSHEQIKGVEGAQLEAAKLWPSETSKNNLSRKLG